MAICLHGTHVWSGGDDVRRCVMLTTIRAKSHMPCDNSRHMQKDKNGYKDGETLFHGYIVLSETKHNSVKNEINKTATFHFSLFHQVVPIEDK